MAKYLVAMVIGSLEDPPEFEFTTKQIIEASSKEEAEKIYNELNNCKFFYGKCVGEYNEATKTVSIPINLL